jgi:hypothetical protein
MSKKKRTQTIRELSITQAIHKSLHADFRCTEDEISIISQALRGKVLVDVAAHINKIAAGKAPLRIRPTMCLDMEDGTSQNIKLTNHPINLLMDYLDEKYDKVFSFLYWSAIVPPNTPKDFYKTICLAKKAPFFMKAIAERPEVAR